MKVRPLIVDGRQKEWTTGEAHDVTDRSFTIRRALRLNDALPGDAAARWSWQPGPWLLVDRTTGHITALHLPDFDDVVSEAVWFRDYAAYCGTGTTAKGGLFAVVAQLGARRAVVQQQIGKWPQAAAGRAGMQAGRWQRAPMRVTLQATGGEAMTFDVVGAASLIEEGDARTTTAVAGRRAAFSSGAPGDIGVQMADGLLLLRNDAVDQVADGDHADHGAVIHHCEMAEVLVGDDAQAFAHRMLAGDGQDGALIMSETGVSLDEWPCRTTLRA